jgi:eukaryotic-like serine/threonine-protein kinase
MRNMIGVQLGAYEIVGKLGEGGMGEVYRARDTKLKREVALKLLPDLFAHDPERLARFEREAHVLASLNHPHIAQIHGVEESGGVRALVMELVEGDTLAERIAHGPIPLEEALPIARQIADALEAAHDAGIIHRDLKPANIKVRGDGTVKVLDFGLAKPGSTARPASGTELNSPTITSPAALTMGGVMLGTAAYMAPEQAKGKAVDKRADIWAFGCVLYEMVTGRRPFEAEDITDTIVAVVSREPDWTRVPSPVLPLLQQCLQKDPRRRLRDIGDIWLLVDDGPQAVSPVPVRGRPTVVAWGAAVLAMLLAAALAYVHFREAPAARSDLTRLQMALPAGAAPDVNFQMSPDGRRLAFHVRGPDGVLRVYLRTLDGMDARPLAGTENAGTGSLFWSPDSRWLAFASQGRLKKIDVISGGSPQTIADVTGAGVIGGAWNRDGVIVIGSNPLGRPGSGGLFKVSADGGTITPLTVIHVGRQEQGHRFPAFLPDGRRFLYLRTSYDPEQSGIFLGNIDTAPEQQSTTRVIATATGPALFMSSGDGGSASAGWLLFSRANALFAQRFNLQTLQLTGDTRGVAEPVGTFLDRGLFTAARTALLYTSAAGALDVQLRWYDASGGTAGEAAGAPGAYTDVGLSPDGARVVVAAPEIERGTRGTLWVMDLARDTRTRLTFGIGRHRSPIWSPDGRAIVYVTDLADGTTIRRKQASGQGAEEVLLKGSEVQTPTSISRDGRWLLYTVAKPDTRLDLWVLPLQHGGEPYPFAATPVVERDAQLSPDGQWVAYVEQDLAGRSDVYVRPFSSPSAPADTQTKWQVSTDGGDFPRWLHGGKQLSYVTAAAADGDTRRVVVVDIIGSPGDRHERSEGFQWGPPRPLVSLPRGTSLFALADDGKRVLAATPASTSAAPRPLTVVLNWLEELEPR